MKRDAEPSGKLHRLMEQAGSRANLPSNTFNATLISNETGKNHFRDGQTESGRKDRGQCFRAGSPRQPRPAGPPRGLLAGGGGRPHRFIHLRKLRDRQ